MIDLERDELWLLRADGYEVRPTPRAPTSCTTATARRTRSSTSRPGKDVVNYSPGELGARTVEILDAAYRSARAARSNRPLADGCTVTRTLCGTGRVGTDVTGLAALRESVQIVAACSRNPAHQGRDLGELPGCRPTAS